MTTIADPDIALLDDLRARLGPQGMVESEAMRPWLEEPRGKWQGRAACVLRPASTEQVAELVTLCAQASVGIIPWGGGTGLVSGQIAQTGPLPVILSLDRMDRIRSVNPEDDAMTVEAGCILARVQETAAEADRLFPLSLASEGSARIGGLLGTNAGGINVLRYGSTRDLVLGIEAVLPDGSVMHGLKNLRKDNTGYDLRHLLIGSEGTLGIITAASLRLFARPREVATAFCAVQDPAMAGDLLRHLRERLGMSIAAIELMAGVGMTFLADVCPDVPAPPVTGPWLVLVEATGGQDSGVAEALEASLADGFEAGLLQDAAIAQSETQRAAFWRIREDLPEANRRIGGISSHDVALSLGDLPAFIAEADAVVHDLDPGMRVNCFGHLGDGNMHYNVFPPEGKSAKTMANMAPELMRRVHDLVHRFGGSISAEHGIGRLKVADLERYGDPTKLQAMRAIKRALDPKGIMNPGAVLAP
jgi:FAD/FMN-containing dehydrogenase